MKTLTCGETLRAGKVCGRPACHDGQHRTTRAMNRRNARKRQATERNAMLRDLAGGVDGRKARTMDAVKWARLTGTPPTHDDYLARKRAAGLID
jgi:hypothetical protein